MHVLLFSEDLQLDALRLAVRQHAIFDDRQKCCRQLEQPAIPTGPDMPRPDMPVPDIASARYASASCQCQMPEPDAQNKNAGTRCLNSGFPQPALKHRKIQVRII